MISVNDNEITAVYTYNTSGLRTAKTVNGNTTEFLLDGANVVAEIKTDNISVYIRGAGLIAGIGSSDNEFYYLSNGHCDTIALTNESGNVIMESFILIHIITIIYQDKELQALQENGAYAGLSSYVVDSDNNIYVLTPDSKNYADWMPFGGK